MRSSVRTCSYLALCAGKGLQACVCRLPLLYLGSMCSWNLPTLFLQKTKLQKRHSGLIVADVRCSGFNMDNNNSFMSAMSSTGFASKVSSASAIFARTKKVVKFIIELGLGLRSVRPARRRCTAGRPAKGVRGAPPPRHVTGLKHAPRGAPGAARRSSMIKVMTMMSRMTIHLRRTRRLWGL